MCIMPMRWATASRFSSGASVGTYPKGGITRDELLNLMAGGKELVDLEQEIIKLNNGKR